MIVCSVIYFQCMKGVAGRAGVNRARVKHFLTHIPLFLSLSARHILFCRLPPFLSLHPHTLLLLTYPSSLTQSPHTFPSLLPPPTHTLFHHFPPTTPQWLSSVIVPLNSSQLTPSCWCVPQQLIYIIFFSSPAQIRVRQKHVCYLSQYACVGF